MSIVWWFSFFDFQFLLLTFFVFFFQVQIQFPIVSAILDTTMDPMGSVSHALQDTIAMVSWKFHAQTIVHPLHYQQLSKIVYAWKAFSISIRHVLHAQSHHHAHLEHIGQFALQNRIHYVPINVPYHLITHWPTIGHPMVDTLTIAPWHVIQLSVELGHISPYSTPPVTAQTHFPGSWAKTTISWDPFRATSLGGQYHFPEMENSSLSGSLDTTMILVWSRCLNGMGLLGSGVVPMMQI